MDEEKDRFNEAFNYSIKLLSGKDYSIYKMKTKLSQRNFNNDEIERVIAKLLDYKYLREDDYMKMSIKQLLVKGYANQYIIRKLALEDLFPTDSDIELIRSEQGLGSTQQIDYLIEKKLRSKEIPYEIEAKMKLKKKILSFLISKGYQFEQAGGRLDRFLENRSL